MDYICSSQKRKKRLQSHQMMQQMTADVPTSSMMSLPIKTILWAKVMVDDLVNLQSRLGSLNTLMAAIKSTGGKRDRWNWEPPDATRALMEITGEVSKSKAETSTAGLGEPSREQLGTSQVTVVVLEESSRHSSGDPVGTMLQSTLGS